MYVQEHKKLYVCTSAIEGGELYFCSVSAQDHQIKWKGPHEFLRKKKLFFTALAAYHSNLALVGGWIKTSGVTTDQVWILEHNDVKPLASQMLTKRHSAVASCYENYLAVAGGKNEDKRDFLTEVEVYDGKQWIQVKPLPEKLRDNLATVIHNGIWYLMEEGDVNTKGFTYYTTLENLVLKQDDDWSSLKVAEAHTAPALFDNNVLIVGQKNWFQYSILMLSKRIHSWVNITGPIQSLDTTQCIGAPNIKCMIGLPEKQLMVISSDSNVKIATVNGMCLVMYMYT